MNEYDRQLAQTALAVALTLASSLHTYLVTVSPGGRFCRRRDAALPGCAHLLGMACWLDRGGGQVQASAGTAPAATGSNRRNYTPPAGSVPDSRTHWPLPRRSRRLNDRAAFQVKGASWPASAPAERDDRIGRALHANGITRPVGVIRVDTTAAAALKVQRPFARAVSPAACRSYRPFRSWRHLLLGIGRGVARRTQAPEVVVGRPSSTHAPSLGACAPGCSPSQSLVRSRLQGVYFSNLPGLFPLAPWADPEAAPIHLDESRRVAIT